MAETTAPRAAPREGFVRVPYVKRTYGDHTGYYGPGRDIDMPASLANSLGLIGGLADAKPLSDVAREAPVVVDAPEQGDVSQTGEREIAASVPAAAVRRVFDEKRAALVNVNGEAAHADDLTEADRQAARDEARAEIDKANAKGSKTEEREPPSEDNSKAGIRHETHDHRAIDLDEIEREAGAAFENARETIGTSRAASNSNRGGSKRVGSAKVDDKPVRGASRAGATRRGRRS